MKTLFFALGILLAFTSGRAAALDQAKVHAAYNEGEFDVVQRELETFVAVNKTFSHEDSVFVCKHLAVIYSASPETAEKGRFFMYRLLEIMPYAQLVDMYVSEEIDRIFERVRAEFYVRQKATGAAALRPASLPATATRAAPEARPAIPEPPQLGAAWASQLLCEGTALDIDLVGGFRSFAVKKWPMLGSQALLGLAASWRPWPIPVALAGRTYFSQARASEKDPAGFYQKISLSSQLFETDLGARAALEKFTYCQPFLEGGAAYMVANVKNLTLGSGFADAGPGAWLGVGAQARLFRHLHIAAQYSRVYSSLFIAGESGAGSGDALLASLGYCW